MKPACAILTASLIALGISGCNKKETPVTVVEQDPNPQPPQPDSKPETHEIPQPTEPNRTTAVADLAGEWKVTYSNGYDRLYVIDRDGNLNFNAEGVTGQIKQEGTTMLIEFDKNDQLERYTLRSDGQLSVEHYHRKSDFPEKKPNVTGIGVRQK